MWYNLVIFRTKFHYQWRKMQVCRSDKILDPFQDLIFYIMRGLGPTLMWNLFHVRVFILDLTDIFCRMLICIECIVMHSEMYVVSAFIIMLLASEINVHFCYCCDSAGKKFLIFRFLWYWLWYIIIHSKYIKSVLEQFTDYLKLFISVWECPTSPFSWELPVFIISAWT